MCRMFVRVCIFVFSDDICRDSSCTLLITGLKRFANWFRIHIFVPDNISQIQDFMCKSIQTDEVKFREKVNMSLILAESVEGNPLGIIYQN